MVRCSVATKLAAHQRHEALKWLEAGETTREIALSYNVAHTTIFAVEACRSAALANAFPTGGSKTGRELSTIVTRVCVRHSISQKSASWTCTHFNALSAITYLRPLPPTKIPCIRRPLADGFKVISTHKNNTAAEVPQV
jgi:hypothetical protein